MLAEDSGNSSHPSSAGQCRETWSEATSFVPHERLRRWLETVFMLQSGAIQNDHGRLTAFRPEKFAPGATNFEALLLTLRGKKQAAEILAQTHKNDPSFVFMEPDRLSQQCSGWIKNLKIYFSGLVWLNRLFLSSPGNVSSLNEYNGRAVLINGIQKSERVKKFF